LFEEHEVFNDEELAVDSAVSFEDLEDYLNLPPDQRKLSQTNEI
jgi:hypothetical protein